VPRGHFVVCEPDYTDDDPDGVQLQAMTPQKIMETASCVN